MISKKNFLIKAKKDFVLVVPKGDLIWGKKMSLVSLFGTAYNLQYQIKKLSPKK